LKFGVPFPFGTWPPSRAASRLLRHQPHHFINLLRNLIPPISPSPGKGTLFRRTPQSARWLVRPNSQLYLKSSSTCGKRKGKAFTFAGRSLRCSLVFVTCNCPQCLCLAYPCVLCAISRVPALGRHSQEQTERARSILVEMSAVPRRRHIARRGL